MSHTEIISLIFLVTILVGLCYYYFILLFVRLNKSAALFTLVLSIIIYGLFFIIKPINIYLNDLVMLTAAASFGAVIGRSIRNIPSVISFAIAASIVDIFSFTFGTTRKIIENAKTSGWGPDNLLSHLAFSIQINKHVVPIIGIGDFIIIGIFYIALYQINIPKFLQILLPLVGLMIALTIGLIAGGIFAIPFMSLPVLVYLFWKRHNLTQL